jgi:hypothetical protein
MPSRRRTVGARAAIVAQYEQRGLAAFALFPCLDLLAAQFTEVLPTECMAIDKQNIRLCR